MYLLLSDSMSSLYADSRQAQGVSYMAKLWERISATPKVRMIRSQHICCLLDMYRYIHIYIYTGMYMYVYVNTYTYTYTNV